MGKWDWHKERRAFHGDGFILAPDAHERSWHRICPVCGGEGSVQISWGTRLDPPDYDVCPNCEGIGRVDQLRWLLGQQMMLNEFGGDLQYEWEQVKWTMYVLSDPWQAMRREYGYEDTSPANMRDWYEVVLRNMREHNERVARIKKELAAGYPYDWQRERVFA
jgi:phage terminase large subunit GpA-like protein